MSQIEFGTKKAHSFAGDGISNIDGIQIFHAEGDQEVRFQGLEKQGGTLYLNGSLVALPAQERIVGDMIKELQKIHRKLTGG